MKTLASLKFSSATLATVILSLSCVVAAFMFSFLSYQFSGTVLSLFIFWPLFLALRNSQTYLSFLSKLWIFYSSAFVFILFGLIFFVQNDAQVGLPLATLIVVLFAVIHEFPFALFISLVYPLVRFFKLSSISMLLLSCLFIFAARKLPVLIFPVRLSVSLGGGDSSFKQLFSLFGVEGVEFLFLIANVFVVFIILQIRGKKAKRAFATSMLLFLYLSSFYILAKHEQTKWQDGDKKLNFAFYQPGHVWKFDGNIPERLDLEFGDLQNLDRILTNLPKSVELLILPETYIFSDINVDSDQIDFLQQTIKEYKIPLLAGGHSLDLALQSNYNNIFLLDGEGQLQAEYYKRLLIPVGEYKPFRDSYPTLSRYMPGKNLYLHGGQSKPLMEFKNFRIGLAICYEDSWTKMFREFVEHNADFVVSVSSDNLFHSAVFAQNHSNMAVSHSLAMRLPLIRVTNTGISSVTDASGATLVKTVDRAEELKMVELRMPRNKSKSLFYLYEWPQLLAATILIVLIIILFEFKCRRPRCQS